MIMLELTDQKWNELTHAYGSAANIPELLNSLSTTPKHESYRDEPYFTLWSALCHQGDVYTASYAAFPYLIGACEENPKRTNWSVLQLAVHIEMARLTNPKAPNIPDFLGESYFQAKQKMALVGSQIMQLNPSEEVALATMMSLALRIDNGEWAQSLSEFNPSVAKKFLDNFWEGEFDA